MKLEIGDLIFTYKKRSLFSWLIASVSQTPYSHASMYIGDGKIIESAYLTKGVKINENHYLTDKYIYNVYRVKASSEQIQQAVEFAKSKDSVKYATIQVVFLGLLYLCGWFKLNILHLDVDKGMTCSEFVATCYKQVGISLCDNPAASTPFELTQSSNVEKII